MNLFRKKIHQVFAYLGLPFQKQKHKYNLTEQSHVVEVGGHDGKWAEEIFSTYGCRITIFEPLAEHYNLLKRRFKNNPKITIRHYGLMDKNISIPISREGGHSSLFRIDRSSPSEEVCMVRASDFFNEKGEIDLISFNCEGCEYVVIPHLIEEGLIEKFKNIQIQFHNISGDAEYLMNNIRKRLSQTHYPTHQYDFVWDNWRRKDLQ